VVDSVYVVVIYEVSVERVGKVGQFLRQYLNWVQNSAFEGELSKGKLARIEVGLRKIIDESVDSVLIFSVSSQKWLEKRVIGVEKSEPTSII